MAVVASVLMEFGHKASSGSSLLNTIQTEESPTIYSSILVPGMRVTSECLAGKNE